MGRKLLAVIVAIIVSNAIFLIAIMIATIFAAFAPKNLEYMTAAERAAYFGSMPIGAYLTELAGYVLGSVAAGWIVVRISKDRHGFTLPIIVGAILTLGGLVTLFSTMPGQPAWVVALSLLIFLPFTLIGKRVAS